ncbi:DOPA-like domain-containing protein [Hygrophoropsis aurantiaca]|uniref:DOPA-like domain-containing protein n=1 Tax=Hygrophoropsis aurantiaca TaxID=72124 RepID=A0ACB8ADK0_9AGAM|nr:DOPA-like domain-containing protein [Hygrophoropsis aurantiaca]
MSKWQSPLAGYENAEPLPTAFNPVTKALVGIPAPQSKSYDEFPKPIDSSSNGFDFHIYYMQGVPEEAKYAQELHERIRREFPELPIFRLWDKPMGPHPTAMFEVDTFNPHQTGALFSWLTVNRGPCDVFIHPNTGDFYKDHTVLASWMGRQWPLYSDVLKDVPPPDNNGTPVWK